MATKKILLIDDSEIDNFIHQTLLKKTHVPLDIQIETSAVEALQYLKGLGEQEALFPDILFLDIRMPLMDGFEFMEEFRNLPKVCRDKCKVYMLSSSIDPIDRERSKNYIPENNHLTKPLAHHPLEELIA
jgi:CheY-like chemotaxis protein